MSITFQKQTDTPQGKPQVDVSCFYEFAFAILMEEIKIRFILSESLLILA